MDNPRPTTTSSPSVARKPTMMRTNRRMGRLPCWREIPSPGCKRPPAPGQGRRGESAGAQRAHLGLDAAMLGPRPFEIVGQLHFQPEPFRGAEIARQPQRRVGADLAVAGDQGGNPLHRHVEVAGQPLDIDAAGLQELLAQHLARMDVWSHVHHAVSSSRLIASAGAAATAPPGPEPSPKPGCRLNGTCAVDATFGIMPEGGGRTDGWSGPHLGGEAGILPGIETTLHVDDPGLAGLQQLAPDGGGADPAQAGDDDLAVGGDGEGLDLEVAHRAEDRAGDALGSELLLLADIDQDRLAGIQHGTDDRGLQFDEAGVQDAHVCSPLQEDFTSLKTCNPISQVHSTQIFCVEMCLLLY
ncbi:hypothetical protein MTBUT4_360034 [Magnetospirillum sp. UT-4]|nr:hypothetical protein MTBUT4_360034 [Magnetospirillum sp. UT-4]